MIRTFRPAWSLTFGGVGTLNSPSALTVSLRCLAGVFLHDASCGALLLKAGEHLRIIEMSFRFAIFADNRSSLL